MRAPLRHAIVTLRAAGLEVDCVCEATRHTEIHLANGKLYRVPLGTRPSRRFERGLRSFIRKLSRTEVSA